MSRRIYTECLTIIFSKAGTRLASNDGRCAREACGGVVRHGEPVWSVRHNRSDGWQATRDIHPECGDVMEYRSLGMVRPATDIIPMDERRGQRA